MKIGVIGHMGIVGGAVRHGLERLGHRVTGCDPRAPASSLADVLDTEVVFVCVPTPQGQDGACQIGVVEDVVAELDKHRYPGVVAIKSTVTPGTTARLYAKHGGNTRIAFCPEFLRERAAIVDFFEHHDLCVIGTQGAQTTRDAAIIAEAHGSLPKHVATMGVTEAELCKYFSNVLNALRVVFANEFYEVAQALGADYQAIKAAMVKRTTIPDVYLDCNDNMRGFGGMCLPKDTAAFAHLVRQLGLDLRLFEMIVDENRKFRTTVPEGMRS
jgi:UDPglucose 6-dehydrogenase